MRRFCSCRMVVPGYIPGLGAVGMHKIGSQLVRSDETIDEGN